MDFELTYSEEQEGFRAEVNAWFDEHVPEGVGRRPTNPEESTQLYKLHREFGRQLGEKGWLYPAGDPEYGGGGLTFDQIIVLEEESTKRGFSLPPYYDSGGKMGGACLRIFGTPEQKEAFLRPIYRGEVRTFQLLTEPTAGSDLAGVKMTAVRDGDDYILNGTKIYIGSSNGADRLWVLANTDPGGERHKNLSWFMVDANSPGITMQPQWMLSPGAEGDTDPYGHKNTIYFEDVRVPAFSLIGGENNGWKVASTHLEAEHSGAGNIRPNKVWGHLLRYCRTTERDGRPLIEDAEVQERLAEIYSRLEVVRLLQTRNFYKLYANEHRTYEGSQVSYVRKTTDLWLTKAVHDLLGFDALTDDPVHGALDGIAEYEQRAGIVGMHPGGTTDIQRVIMARRLGLGKREREKAGSLGVESTRRRSTERN
ncbi:acyl-CoA dehydrogenase family protein [Streptomyces sp. NPDC050625]|uniref:acyl-CoA dehydrogenase family protein n=1 Tax=Streptomyces sp. NPDC050625 TaxID=3154629 RepID=UPI00342968CC